MGHVIGIGGSKGSGKDTVADILISYFGYQKISFADPIKQILANATQFTYEDLNNQDIKETSISELIPGLEPYILLNHEISTIIDTLFLFYPTLTSEDSEKIYQFFVDQDFKTLRDLMQKFGTDLCRNQINQEIWTTIFKDQTYEGKFVCSDVRFENERKTIKELGGVLILTNRNTKTDQRFQKDLHISENDFGNHDEYDVFVNNNGTKSDLIADIQLWHQTKFPKIPTIPKLKEKITYKKQFPKKPIKKK